MELEYPLKELLAASEETRELVTDRLVDSKGVHVETAITACAALGGVSLLRTAGVALENLPEGSAVLVASVDEAGPRIMSVLCDVAKSYKIDPHTGWNDPIPSQHESKAPFSQLILRLEPEANAIYQKFSIDSKWVPAIATLAALKLVKLGEAALNQNLGKAILLKSFVAAAKTVPLRTGNTVGGKK